MLAVKACIVSSSPDVAGDRLQRQIKEITWPSVEHEKYVRDGRAREKRAPMYLDQKPASPVTDLDEAESFLGSI